MIEGVVVKKLGAICDERGRLMEVLRSDDEFYQDFGQLYLTTAYPGVTKAWHYHLKQTDHLCCVSGMLKIVLFDSREKSPTKGEINEFFVGAHNPALILIPPLVYHGFKCISETEAVVLNVPTKVYDRREPDEYRVDPHSGEVPYDWERKDG